MNKPIFFISDLHFGLQSKEKESKLEKKFVSFLHFAMEEAGELYILGDLFDYWFEYRRVIQRGYFNTFTALKNLVDSGVKVYYIIGNHDFMHRDFFTKEIGVKLYGDVIETELLGKKFYLAHGDGLVKNDLGYRILKKVLRNKFLQWMYSLVHPDFGIWLASFSSKTSRDYTSDKDYGSDDGLFDAAKNKIENGFDYVLFGHTHRRKFEQYKNGHYINLGTWLDKPCYGKFNGSSFEIIDWE